MTTQMRAKVTLEDLVAKYPGASLEEAPGILRAAVKFVNNKLSKSDSYPFGEDDLFSLVNYLTIHGNEDPDRISEPVYELREEARKVLIRHVLKQCFVDRIRRTDRMADAAAVCVNFFASNVRHCEATARDRETMHSFLESMVHLLKKDMVLANKINRISLLHALVNSEHFSLLVNNLEMNAINLLYNRLARRSVIRVEPIFEEGKVPSAEEIFLLCGEEMYGFSPSGGLKKSLIEALLKLFAIYVAIRHEDAKRAGLSSK